jgi:hypothetical protein
MSGLYFVWLAAEIKRQHENKKQDKRRTKRKVRRRGFRSDYREKALSRSILRAQLFEVFGTPGKAILDNLEESIENLEMELDYAETFYSRQKVLHKIQEALKGVTVCLKRAYYNNNFTRKWALQSQLGQMIINASELDKQIYINFDSDRFLEYMKKKIELLIDSYRRTIGKDFSLAEQKAEEIRVMIETAEKDRIGLANRD